MRFARIIDGTAVDTRDTPATGCYTDDFVAQFVSVPDDVENGWLWDGTDWTAPAEVTPPEVVVDLSAAKAAKNIQISLWRAQANQSTFTHAGKVIACDPLSRSDIDAVAASVAMTGAFPAGFPGAWKAVDNSYIMLPDVAAFKALHASMTTAGTAHFAHSQALKAALAAATDQAGIDAVVW